MKGPHAVSLICVFLILSCTNKTDNSIITFQLKKSDYIEKLDVAGTVQAVVNFPVVPPRGIMGRLTVVKLAEDGKFVKKGDTICVLSAGEIRATLSEQKNSVETLEAGLKKTEADNKLNIALLEAQLATSEAQLKISSLDSLRMQYAQEVTKKLLKLEMRKSLIEKQKIEKKLASQKLIGETDIRQIKARIIGEKTKCQSLEEQVNSLIIIAQRDGIVIRGEMPTFYMMGSGGVTKMGGPIKEGTVLFMNTAVLQFPDLSKMQISAEVPEAEFRKIEKGQKVNIVVEASGKLATTGIVNRKSLMGRTAERWSDSQVKFYEIIIDIDSCDSKMTPGLSAGCSISLKEVRDTLFVPTLAIFERDSSRVVYVKSKNKFTPVKIETGISGSSHTIISGGLKGDEIIALSEPPNRLILQNKIKTDTTDIVKNIIHK
jgi:macrolide-specific efflux system membrane fusion protein